jgi:hypothetical protein
MPWYNKEQATPFDAMPARGLFFLNGDIVVRRYQQDWTPLDTLWQPHQH